MLVTVDNKGIMRSNMIPAATYEIDHDLTNFQNANVSTVLKIPFTVQIPLRIYPSCLFGSNTFVKHYLCVDFPSIGAKKTSIIVIKNPPYFSHYNHLYQAPAMCYKEMKKHKIIFSQGSFVASVRLPKNAFKYEEPIPFEIDIDMTKLAISVKIMLFGASSLGLSISWFGVECYNISDARKNCVFG